MNKEERRLAKENKIKFKALENQRSRIYDAMIVKQKKSKKEKKIAPKGSYISLQNINKIYPNKVQAVYDFNLDIKKNEFIVFVGPSGCGKSTTLRMIAGLEDITGGDLYIDGIYANDLQPKDRDIAMVFQSYALYPNMSVSGNMGFGLKIRKVPTQLIDKDGNPILGINKGLIKDAEKELKNLIEYKSELDKKGQSEKSKEYEVYIKEQQEKVEHLKVTPVPLFARKHMPRSEIRSRVEKAAEILQITEYLTRKPKALSGGQCQRVALGRAIVRNAKVFLMDEPLSNLDAKLRVAMRSEIVKLHNSLNATTIYVTHDQTEAMTMATRIVVMNKGYIQQIGSPIEIYNRPANLFVATFIGSPAMNLFDVEYSNGTIKFKNDISIKLEKDVDIKVKSFYKDELQAYKTELASIDESFIERKVVLNKIVETEASTKFAQTEKEDAISKLQKELAQVEESHDRRVYLVNAIASYEELKSKTSYPLIFGIRPEDIFKSNETIQKDDFMSKPFNLEVQVAELMGHEYYLHTDFADKDLVSKISTKKIVNIGDKIKLCFDLQRIHLFDQVSQKLVY